MVCALFLQITIPKIMKCLKGERGAAAGAVAEQDAGLGAQDREERARLLQHQIDDLMDFLIAEDQRLDERDQLLDGNEEVRQHLEAIIQRQRVAADRNSTAGLTNNQI